MNGRVALLCLCLGGCALGRGGEVATLGRVDEEALPRPGNWLLAASPSILRYRPSRRLEADVQAAIAHYEAVAAAATDEEGRTEALRRAAYLRLQLAEQAPDASRAELQQAVAHYQALLQAAPADPNGDQTLYQLARAWQALGEPAAALGSLRALQQAYPDSPLQGDVAFRLAEMQFAGGEYARAADDYRRVLVDPGGGRFIEMAQYKLGWAEFRQGRFGPAVEQFLAILERELPAQVGDEPAQVLQAVAAGRRPWVEDALRVISLCLAAEGGAAAWPLYYARPADEPAYAPLLYMALGELLLEKRHFTAAAAAFAAFTQRHPLAEQAPRFARRRIDSLDQGGFAAAKIDAMIAFVDRYAPDAPYWAGQAPDSAWQAVWLADVDALAAHYHHQAQQGEAAGRPSARQDFLSAARWYQRRLQLMPAAAGAARSQLLLAEALQAAGLGGQAIAHFERAAYDYPGFEGAADAAYAGLLVRLEQAAADPREQRHALQAADRLMAAFPDHPHWIAVSMRSMQARMNLRQWPIVLSQAQALLRRDDLDRERHGQALAMLADARFASADYAAAEQAYRQMLQGHDHPGEAAVSSNLALAIYRQGEAARDRAELVEAARHFLRLGELLPEAAIRSTAEFDAAAALLALAELAAAQSVLEQLLHRDPGHALAGEAQRKLAAVYEQRGLSLPAAELYLAMASTATEPAMAREALWHAGELYRAAGALTQVEALLTRYVEQYPHPLHRALQACRQLAELGGQARPQVRERWLRQLVTLESSAGSARDGRSRLQSARAALELGELALQRAAAQELRPPLPGSIRRRRAALDEGLKWLARAADDGFVETVPQATFATATAYAGLAAALLKAGLPAGLGELEQEEFRMLLEEQAFPFEELAIQWHETNLAHLRQQIWNEWVAASADALALMVPARYAKSEILEQQHVALD